MTQPESERVKAAIAAILAAKAATQIPELHDDLDLRSAGLVDSLGFVQLIDALERRLGYPVNLAELNPNELTRVGPLSRHIAWRRALP